MGWERMKGAFLAKKTREAVKNLHRQCQALNSMAAIDTVALAANTHHEVKEIRKEQQQVRGVVDEVRGCRVNREATDCHAIPSRR